MPEAEKDWHAQIISVFIKACLLKSDLHNKTFVNVQLVTHLEEVQLLGRMGAAGNYNEHCLQYSDILWVKRSIEKISFWLVDKNYPLQMHYVFSYKM